jgi:hypothetical protein
MSQQSLQLRDIHLPASPDIWPPAPGWWLLATILLFLLGWGWFKWLQHRKRQREQQAIMQNLIPIEKQLLSQPDNETLAKLNILLRQLALMHYPHKQIASLNGKNWLGFLDQSGQTSEFSQGIGRVLAEAPYRANDATTLSIKQSKKLLALVKNWINKAITHQAGVTR